MGGTAWGQGIYDIETQKLGMGHGTWDMGY